MFSLHHSKLSFVTGQPPHKFARFLSVFGRRYYNRLVPLTPRSFTIVEIGPRHVEDPLCISLYTQPTTSRVHGAGE